MTDRHTPAQWGRIDFGFGWDIFKDDRIIARGVKNDANARLIAAAPELLGALKRIEPILTTLSFSEAHFQSLEAVRATIRKAEGDNDVE